MKLYAIILLLLVGGRNFGREQQKTDSLHNALKNATRDTSRVKICLKLCELFRNSNPDSALFYANKGLAAAMKANWKKGLSDCYINIGVVYHYKSDFKNATENYKRSLKVNEELGDKIVQSQCYNNLGTAYCE
ncbi:MAG: tetratricopeptide repeat protein [Bacteroidia bacterium]|nr:tetratricopeptide repeat protein [Bacteroidia bacterium]